MFKTFPFKVKLIFRGSKKELIITVNEDGANKTFKTFRSFIDHLNIMVLRDKDFQFNSYTYAFKPKDVSAYELHTETQEELSALREKFLSIEKNDANKHTEYMKKLTESINRTKDEDFEVYEEF